MQWRRENAYGVKWADRLVMPDDCIQTMQTTAFVVTVD